jgi:protein phosphatase 1 regulatory subunit 14B
MEAGGVLTADRSPARGNLHVAFTVKGEVKERREKFLTAKYGSHQMSLIRKRLAVEMWLFEELQKLYESVVSCLNLGATNVILGTRMTDY